MNRKSTIVLAALVLFCAPFSSMASLPSEGEPSDQQYPVDGADVQYDMLLGRANTTEPKFTVTLGHADNGTVTATLNGASKTMTIQKGGQVAVLSFSALAQQQYPGSSAAQEAFVNEMTALASNRDLLVSFESYSFRSGIGMDNGMPEMQCALIPCRREVDPLHPNNNIYVTTYRPDWLIGVTPPPPGPATYPGYSAEIVAYDRARWELARDEACSNAHTQAAEFFLTAIGTGATCLTAETGIGAAVCGSGIALLGVQARRGSSDERLCHRPYPGPGKW